MQLPATLQHTLQHTWEIRQRNFPPTIVFDTPSQTLPISLTGPHCALNCAHCGGHYLRHMHTLDNLPNAPTHSYLISGGCDPQGKVPVTRHLDRIRVLCTTRPCNWHVGMITEEEIRTIAPYVHTISFDFIGDTETIREVYGLPYTPEDYAATYAMLRRYAPTVPHITIGLRGGELGHERPALRLLAELGADAIVFLVLIPTPDTRYADREPPPIEAVIDLIAEARQLLPHTLLHLGCMRPGGSYRAQLDPLAIYAGINRIVQPAPSARETAQALGLQIVETKACCVFSPTEERR